MAKTVEFVGFEQGVGYEDADHKPGTAAVGPATIVSSPAPPYGNFSLQLTQGGVAPSYDAGDVITSPGSTGFLSADYFRFSSIGWPPTNGSALINTLFGAADSGGSVYWRMRVNTSGQIELLDDGAAILATSPALDPSTYYRTELIWTPGSASSEWAWYLEEPGGSPSLEASGSGADFTAGGGLTVRHRLGGQDGPPLSYPITVHHAGAYLMEDVADIDDRVGGQEGKTGDFVEVITDGRMTKNSGVPDVSETGGAPGAEDTLDGGTTWDDLATAAGSARYSVAQGDPTEGGAVKIDAIASRPVDQVYGQKWIWVGRRAGSDTADRFVVYGRFDPATSVYTTALEVWSTITTTNTYTRRIQDWQDLGLLPHRLHAVQGIAEDPSNSPRNFGQILVDEAWFSTLEAIPVLTAKPSIGRFGNMWRGKRGRPL